MRFAPIEAPPRRGTLVYRISERSFDFIHEGPSPTGGYSLLVNDLQLEIDGSGRVLYPWGIAPRERWQQMSSGPPNPVEGGLRALFTTRPTLGTSQRLNKERWATAFDQHTGWVCVGNSRLTGDIAVEFATNCIAVISGEQLVALWLRPLMDPSLSKT